MPRPKPIDAKALAEALGVDELGIELTLFYRGRQEVVAFHFRNGRLVKTKTRSRQPKPKR